MTGVRLGAATKRRGKFRLFSAPRSGAALTPPRGVIHSRAHSNPVTLARSIKKKGKKIFPLFFGRDDRIRFSAEKPRRENSPPDCFQDPPFESFRICRKTKGTVVTVPFVFGRDDRIRTCGFYVPNVALYQTEPHLVMKLLPMPIDHQPLAQTSALRAERHRRKVASYRLGTLGSVCSRFRRFRFAKNSYQLFLPCYYQTEPHLVSTSYYSTRPGFCQELSCFL